MLTSCVARLHNYHQCHPVSCHAFGRNLLDLFRQMQARKINPHFFLVHLLSLRSMALLHGRSVIQDWMTMHAVCQYHPHSMTCLADKHAAVARQSCLLLYTSHAWNRLMQSQSYRTHSKRHRWDYVHCWVLVVKALIDEEWFDCYSALELLLQVRGLRIGAMQREWRILSALDFRIVPSWADLWHTWQIEHPRGFALFDLFDFPVTRRMPLNSVPFKDTSTLPSNKS